MWLSIYKNKDGSFVSLEVPSKIINDIPLEVVATNHYYINVFRIFPINYACDVSRIIKYKLHLGRPL